MSMSSPHRGRPDLFSRVATAPISWGVCEVPGWGILHDERQAEATMDRARGTAELLAALDAPFFNTAPVTSRDWQPRRPLSEAEWTQVYVMLDRLDQLCADLGLHQVVHEHVGCIVETDDDVQRLLADTSVRFVLDTGHLALGGFDPLDFAKNHADRVGLVHLKDTRFDVAEQLIQGELSLMESVQHGLFPALGQGELPLADIVATLEQSGYDGWYVIEQDSALTHGLPPAGDGPMLDVALSVTFLNDNIRALGPPAGLRSRVQ